MIRNMRSHTKLLLSLFLATAYCNDTQARDIRSITPPNLSATHLGKKILCHRPMRHGSPDMAVRSITTGTDDALLKIVATNAGHGGSGWTLGPGCATYVNSMMIDSSFAQNLTTQTPITIIGAGALGLFSAYDLIQRGFSNITIIAEQTENLTSHNAGGLLAPVSMDNDPEMQKIINQIGYDAYNFYADIAHGNLPAFQGGAAIVPTYFQNRENSGLEPYVGIVMQPAKDVTLDFGNGTTQDMVAYDDGIFINTAIMMDGLHNYLADKVTFVTQKITDFAQIQDEFIINCTGLGAKDLNNDDEFISVQGHLIMLKDQNPADLQHMILVYFNDGKTASGFDITRSFYMFPKQLAGSDINDIGVIGGTFIEGATADTPNLEEFDIMLQGAKDFYGIQD